MIRILDLSVSAGDKTLIAVERLEFEPGFTAIVGPNGAGKTTLLRAVVGAVRQRGTVEIHDTPASSLSPQARARAVSYLPQAPVFHWPLPVRDVVALGRFPHGDADAPSGVAVIDRVLEATGLSAFADRAASTLSGGERARVALARALAVDAGCLLADEPAAALDPRYQLDIFSLLSATAEAGCTVVAVTHDLNAAMRFADRVLVVSEGAVVADAPPDDALTGDRIAAVFGVTPHTVMVNGRPAIAGFRSNPALATPKPSA